MYAKLASVSLNQPIKPIFQNYTKVPKGQNSKVSKLEKEQKNQESDLRREKTN